MHDFKKLLVYQKALVFTKIVRQTTTNFPKEELFGLNAQFRRPSDSIVLNIAVGAGNSSKKEFSRLLDIVIRSGFECVGCLDIALENNFITTKGYEEILARVHEITAMLYGLKKKL